MYEINIPYFLFGMVGLMLFRLIDEMKMFNPDFEAPKYHQKVFYFSLGMVFLLSAGNGILLQWKLKTLLPIIFLIIGSALSISDSFTKPSRNYLISICIGVVVGGVLISPLYDFFQVRRIHINIPYMGLIGIGIAFVIGMGAAMFTYILLYYKYKNGLDETWDGTRFWRIVNNRIFVLILWIIMVIELFLQLRGSSLISLFYPI